MRAPEPPISAKLSTHPNHHGPRSIARWIWMVAAGWLAVVIGSNSRCSRGCAIVCTSMYSPINASDAPWRQRPSYSGIRCVERDG